jgi:hypothetical protein
VVMGSDRGDGGMGQAQERQSGNTMQMQAWRCRILGREEHLN